MLSFNLVEVGGEYEVHSLQSSSQKAHMHGNESDDVIVTDPALIEERSQIQLSDESPDVQITSSRSLRSARKRQEETNKNKRPEIKDQEAAADSLEEKLANAEVNLQKYQCELEDAQNKLAACKEASKKTKAHLASKKGTCKTLRKKLTTCRRQLKESKDVGRDLKASNSHLQDSLTASEEDLRKCKDDVFSLQRMAQTPDSTISKRFELICQQIVHWIDAEVAAFENAHPEAEPDHMFSVGEDKDSTRFLRHHPGAGEHLARYLIHRFLRNNVFGNKVYFFGLSEETVQLLQNAELKMAELDPPRDTVAIASWRSETLNALATTTECRDFCQRQAQDVNSRLFKELSKSLPNLFSGPQSHATFYDQVLLPAVKLANTIRMSTSDYVFSIQESPIKKFRPVITESLEMHKMINFKSGKQLKPDSAVVADEDGIIGDFIIGLEPGLYRVIKGKDTTLRQGMFLVELNHPLGKRSKASA